MLWIVMCWYGVNMLTEEERKAFAGFDEMVREDEKRWPPPTCHMTPMFLDASDDERWWECKHCGHTKALGT